MQLGWLHTSFNSHFPAQPVLDGWSSIFFFWLFEKENNLLGQTVQGWDAKLH